MDNQKIIGWREQNESYAARKVVLNADPQTFHSLCTRGCLRLRLFCEQGSSVMVSLESKDRELVDNDDGEIRLVTLALTREALIGSIERNLEITFYNQESREAAHFRIIAVSQDQWLSDMKPLCEHIQ